MRPSVLLFASVMVAVPVLAASPANASAASPQVGECFKVTNGDVQEEKWFGTSPVPCSSAHTLEITATGAIPADVNALTFSAAKCANEYVLDDRGFNLSVDGVVVNPIRLGATNYLVSRPGTPTTYACGVFFTKFRGAGGPVLEAVKARVANLTDAQLRTFRYCGTAPVTLAKLATSTTVRCSVTPRWQIVKTVDLSEEFDDFPGEATLKAHTRTVCPIATRLVLPSAAAWRQGQQVALCWFRYP